MRGTSGEDDIIMVSRSSYAARFQRVRACGRWAATLPAVRGMNVSEKGNAVLAMDVARDEVEPLVVTENGFGKRTLIADYPVKGRGTKGVKTIQLTDHKVRSRARGWWHEELLFISQEGMVQRTGVRGISKMAVPRRA